jgi:hypothetical protein
MREFKTLQTPTSTFSKEGIAQPSALLKIIGNSAQSISKKLPVRQLVWLAI